MSYRFIIDYKYSTEVLGYIAVGFGVSSAVFGSLEAIAMQYFNPIFLKDILDAQKTKEQKHGIRWQVYSTIIYIYFSF